MGNQQVGKDEIYLEYPLNKQYLVSNKGNVINTKTGRKLKGALHLGYPRFHL